MKKLLLTLLLSTSLSTFALQGKRVDLNFWFDSFCYKSPKVQTRNGVFYLPNQQEPFTGENLCVYTNGQYHSKGDLLNGLGDGKWTWWYENGQISQEGNYKDDEMDGKWIWWHKNGQIKSEATYKDGECISGDC